MPPSNIVNAADYADAMMIARRAKNWLFLLLLLMLLIQLSLFFVTRYTDYVLPAPATTESLADKVAPASGTAIAAAVPATAPSADPARTDRMRLIREVLWYLTAVINFLGIVLTIALALVLLMIVNIMLVGRLVGVAQVTSAWVWCIVLALFLFPWQAFLQTPDFRGDFKIPGVLYTWNELVHPTTGARFKVDAGWEQATLRWARFVGFPLASLIVLLMVQARSSRGLRAALGETELESTGEMTIS